MGRVGRIDFNLFGNVYLVIPKDEKNKLEATYLGLLKERMPEQRLFFDKYSDFEVAVIDEAISNSDYAFSNMNLDSEKLETVRKILVVLLDDAKVRNDSPVVKKFFGKALNEVKAKIYSVARQTPEAKTSDLTQNQVDLLLDSIQDDDLYYPVFTDEDSVYSFLN